jgi:hypothetical protein
MRLDLNVVSVASSIIVRNVRANLDSRKVKKKVSNLKSSLSGKIANLSL